MPLQTSTNAPHNDAGQGSSDAADGGDIQFIKEIKNTRDSRQLVGMAYGGQAVWALVTTSSARDLTCQGHCCNQGRFARDTGRGHREKR